MANVNSYSYQRVHDQRLAASINVAAVVQVTSFDPAKMTVNVQPISKHLENGNYESQPPVLGIPVACTRSGGFVFRPWFKAGDTGVVVYLDHDLDSALSGGKESQPQTERNHSASDAVFIGAIVTGGATLSGIPEESIALATEDGSIYVAVTKDEIQMVNDSTKLTMTKSKVLIEGDVEITGKVTATKDVISESIYSSAHHTHTGNLGNPTSTPLP